MADTSSLDALIEALRRLPGVGVKSASRMAFHLLQHDREGAQLLARALEQAAEQRAALQRVPHLHRGRGLRHLPRPAARPQQAVRGRDAGRPGGAGAHRAFRGLYFVLMGKLSPLDGIGPKDIGLAKLFDARHRRRGAGGDPGDQLHRRRRGHGARDRRGAQAARPEGDAAGARRAGRQRTRIRGPGHHRARAGGQRETK